ncbi:MAG: hypothetical protein C5B58_04400 [Acidobacteria bacterium]|nr:MAG: hypothetical protein C5B58_04400 [Acidobacteriota bacterium]
MPVRDLVSKVYVEPPTSPKGSRRKTLIRGATNSAIAATAFLITCISLHAVLPFPEIDGGVSQKFRFFAAHKDEFDTLFIGSSRVYFQISPAIFDRVTRENGRPTHSFNFGIGGMYLPESAYLLEQILDLKPRNLRWVFIEYDELQTKWSAENQSSRRALYWADWRRISLLLRKLTDAGTGRFWQPNPEKLGDIILCRNSEANTRALLMFYLAQFEKQSVNVARAADVADYFLRRDTNKRRASYLGPASDGYLAKPGRMSASQTPAYERALAIATAQTGTLSISPYALEAYRQCAQKVRSIGAVPIFLITPSTTEVNLAYNESTDPPGTMMAFNDPRSYPGLYHSSVRRDGQHLTKSGAEEFTRMVAANLMQLVPSRQTQIIKNQ